MANKKTLKGYFETGDIPNQSQYHELINSNLNLNETGTQILVGTLSSSFLEVENHITSSGNISSSGEITANKFYADGAQTSYISLDSEGLGLGTNGSWKVGTHITASGNISSSGTVIANLIQTPRINGTGGSLYIADPIYVAGGHITASGNISSSGDVYAESIILPFGQAVNWGSHSGNHIRVDSVAGNIIFDALPVRMENGLNVVGHITASGNISATDIIVGDDIILANNSKIMSKNQSNTYILLNNDDYWRINANNTHVAKFSSAGVTINPDSFQSLDFTVNSDNNVAINMNANDETLTFGVPITASGNLKVDGSQVDFTNLPTSDPSVAGRLYRDGTDLKISLG